MWQAKAVCNIFRVNYLSEIFFATDRLLTADSSCRRCCAASAENTGRARTRVAVFLTVAHALTTRPARPLCSSHYTFFVVVVFRYLPPNRFPPIACLNRCICAKHFPCANRSASISFPIAILWVIRSLLLLATCPRNCRWQTAGIRSANELSICYQRNTKKKPKKKHNNNKAKRELCSRAAHARVCVVRLSIFLLNY